MNARPETLPPSTIGRHRAPRDLRAAFGFALFLHLVWILAWLLEQAMESRTEFLNSSDRRTVYWLVAKFLLWALPSILLIRRSSRTLRETMGAGNFRSIVCWGGGVGLVLGLMALTAKWSNHQPFIPSHVGLPFFNAVVVAPFVEEIAFRGVILGALVPRWRFAVANTVTALLFLTIHMVGWYFQDRLMANLRSPLSGAGSIFLIGWILGLVAHKSRSVAASTLTHMLNNLFNA